MNGISIPKQVATAIAEHTGAIYEVKSIGGGCIANASRLVTEYGSFFLKWGEREVAETFAAEAAGLQAIRQAATPLACPKVIATDASSHGFLLMEWLDSAPAGHRMWESLGAGLAALHRSTGNRYGFSSDNFIGRLPQINRYMETWPAFFRACRLEPQVERARSSGGWRSSWNTPLEGLYRRLDSLLPDTPPASLVHGDLWSGNVMALTGQRAALIDPAVYYGHREVDLAMTELFGGFGSGFYEAYNQAWPLEPGYEERRDLYNLYHLINHLNLFGSSYGPGVERMLKRFGG